MFILFYCNNIEMVVIDHFYFLKYHNGMSQITILSETIDCRRRK